MPTVSTTCLDTIHQTKTTNDRFPAIIPVQVKVGQVKANYRNISESILSGQNDQSTPTATA